MTAAPVAGADELRFKSIKYFPSPAYYGRIENYGLMQ